MRRVDPIYAKEIAKFIRELKPELRDFRKNLDVQFLRIRCSERQPVLITKLLQKTYPQFKFKTCAGYIEASKERIQ